MSRTDANPQTVHSGAARARRWRWTAAAAVALLSVGATPLPAMAQSADGPFEVATSFDTGGVATYEIDADGPNVWIAHPDRFVALNGKISVIDSVNRTTRTIDVPDGESPVGLDVNSTSRKAYVTDSDNTNLYVFDADTLEQLKVIDLGESNRGHGIGIDEARNLVYVTAPNNGNSALNVLDGATDTVVGRVELPPGAAPIQVEVDPVRNQYYVTGTQSNAIYVLDSDTNQLVRTISPVPRVQHLALDPVRGIGVAAAFEQGDLVVFDLATGAIQRTIDVSPNWWSSITVVHHPGTGTYLVTDLSSPTVTVVSETTWQVVGTYEIDGTFGLGLEVNPVTGAVYVGDRDTGKITVLLPRDGATPAPPTGTSTTTPAPPATTAPTGPTTPTTAAPPATSTPPATTVPPTTPTTPATTTPPTPPTTAAPGGPATPPAPGAGSSANVGVSVEVPGQPATGGDLTISLAGGAGDLGTLAPGERPGTLAGTGALPDMTVSDSRQGNPGWSASGQLTDLTSSGGTIAASSIGWSPVVASTTEGQSVSAGATVAPGAGDAAPRLLASAAPGSGSGTALICAEMSIVVPAATPAGTYTGTLTLTVI